MFSSRRKSLYTISCLTALGHASLTRISATVPADDHGSSRYHVVIDYTFFGTMPFRVYVVCPVTKFASSLQLLAPCGSTFL